MNCVSVLTFQTQNDFMVICNVAKILELVVPLMEHPSETFLTTIEEDLMKLIIKYGMTVSLQLKRKNMNDVDVKLQLLACRFNLNVMSYVVYFSGCTTLCELSGCCCQQGHAQLQVCLGLFQPLLW